MMQGLSGVKVAKIFGVDLRIHFSLIFLLIYVVFVATAQLPFVVQQAGVDPQALGGAVWVWGFAFAIGLLGSVVIHEFGHVWVAQRMGIQVRSVTLMMLGGVSEMERIPEHRLAEFKIALIGPVVSLALAALLLGLRAASSLPQVDFLAFWLARVNIALAIFNLLPAFPLDGGRAFRSLLAARAGMVRATATVVRVARVFAWIMGLLGLFTFNLLLVLVAFFVYSAAQSEWLLVITRYLLRDTVAGEVGMVTEVLREDQNIDSAAQVMIASKASVLPVATKKGDGALLSLEQLRRVPRSRWSLLRIREVMDHVPGPIESKERIEKHLIDLAAYGALPLLQGGKLVGILRYRDVAEYLEFQSLENQEDENKDTHPFRKVA